MFNISIKTKLLTIFLSLVGLVAVSLLFSQYYFSKKLALESTNKTFTMISENISDHLRIKGTTTRNILNAKKRHQSLLEPITFDPYHPALKGLVQVLEITHDIYALYFAHKDGKFYEVINMRDPILFKSFNAPHTAKWTIITIIDNIQQIAFLDQGLKLISKRNKVKPYDPRKRIWYKTALKHNGISHTPAYRFSNLGKTSVTHSVELDVKGTVLALDYTMVQLNKMLALQKFEHSSEIFLADLKGKKVASSLFHLKESENNQTQMIDTALIKQLEKEKTNTVIRYSDGTDNYYSIFKPLLFKTGYLGIKVNEEPLLKPYKDNFIYSFSIAFILLLLAIPIIIWSTNHIIKPIQLLILENKKIKRREFDKVEQVDTHILEFIELSDSQVAMSKSIQNYQRSQEEILDAIIKLIAEAIDAKSPYTGGHCKRVPLIAKKLLDAANESDNDVFKDFSFTSEEELREFEIGAWLHDCGKVTTPEYVVDKATKLETIYNRIHEIRMRFEVLWRDVIIDHLSQEISKEEMKKRHTQLEDDFCFIASVNIGGEYMDASLQTRVKEIAQQEWQRHFDDRLGLGEVETLRYTTINTDTTLPVTEKLLDDKTEHIVERINFNHDEYEAAGFKGDVPENLYDYGEVYNLCIEKGTLTKEERYKINEHVIMSIKMLEKIPFPETFSNVVEYAGTHHETLIGTGYPRQLSKEDLSIPARIMAIADIFEALTASDRPYKKAKTLSSSIKIMSFMVKDQHIDTDLFKLFLSSGVYKSYAEKFLEPEQIDEVDISKYLDV